MVVYGPTVTNLNLIHDKAKGKRDGVYSFRGVVYRVSDGRFTHFAHNGEILQRAGGFNVLLGKHGGYGCDDAKKALRALKD